MTSITVSCRALDGKARDVVLSGDSSAADLRRSILHSGMERDNDYKMIAVHGTDLQTITLGKPLSAYSKDGRLQIVTVREHPRPEKHRRVTDGVPVIAVPPTLEDIHSHEHNLQQIAADMDIVGSEEGEAGEPTGFTAEAAPTDAQMQLLNVMTVLMELAATIQGALYSESSGAEAPQEEEEEEEDADESLSSEVDTNALNVLESMGFSTIASTKALVLNENDIERATEWLFAHTEDPDLNKPFAPPPKPAPAKTGQKFKINISAYRRLLDCGFQEDQVVAALKLATNDFETAFEYLVSGSDLQAMLSDVESKVASRDSPLVKAILNDATVQTCLAEPRVKRAFERMTQDPSSARLYLHDHQVGPLLVQISQIFARFETIPE